MICILIIKGKFRATNSNPFLLEIKIFFSFSPKIIYRLFSEVYVKNYEHFLKIGESHSLSISEIIDSENTWLLKCLKHLVSEHSSKGNILTSPKHC